MDRPVTGYYPTADGMNYLYSHRHPVRSWMSRNWFPVTVAVVNALIGVGTLLVVWVTRTASRRRRGAVDHRNRKREYL